MAILKKLIRLQGEVKGLASDKKGYNYDYVSGNKMLSAIRPKMTDMGLLLLPEILEIENTVVKYVSVDKASQTTFEKTEILYILKMRMTWADAEDGERMQQEWMTAGLNMFDKGYGSALTYGERYYLLKLLHIQTDKDDVDEVSTERDKAIEDAQVAEIRKKSKMVTGYDQLPPYAAVPQVEYEGWLRLEAEGQLKNGKSALDRWAKKTNATAREIAVFKDDVQNFINQSNTK